MPITKKQIPVVIILTLVTCGIYSLYWMYATQEQLRTVQDEYQTTGGMVILYSILTCGIYQVYWWYKIGLLLPKVESSVEPKGLLYVVLSIFGLDILNIAFVQSDLNRLADLEDQHFDF